MVRFISVRTAISVAIASGITLLVLGAQTEGVKALPEYATATGQPCGACHINPAGGGAFTATGQAFAAISTHATNPAGAWARLSAPAPAPVPAPAPAYGPAPAPATAPAPAPAAAPVPAPAASGPVSLVLSGVVSDGSVTYAITLSNSGDKEVANIFVSGSIPAGASFASTAPAPISAGAPAGNPIPEDAGLYATNAGSVAWVLSALPAKTSVGPFVYKVSTGSATNLSAHAFVHWLSPSDGSAVSANDTPINNSQRLGVDQEINSKLNNLDRTLKLWNLQPGLGTVMIEYSSRFANMWFAAQAGNWDMVRYQNLEMREIQEVGENTRPGRAPALKNFEDNLLGPLDDAAGAKDLGAFVAAYDSAITGCNACHVSQTSADFPGSYRFVAIQRPTSPVLPNVNWQGQP